MSTPLDILEEVKLRFPVLLHDKKEALEVLLRKAVARYQDYAGFEMKMSIESAQSELDFPDDYLCLVNVKDDTGGFVKATEWRQDKKLAIKLRGCESYPLVMTYLRKVGKEEMDSFEVPSTAEGLIADYLEVLIDIPNSQRRRIIAAAGKMDTTDVATEDALNARKVELEEKISANRLILSPLSVR